MKRILCALLLTLALAAPALAVPEASVCESARDFMRQMDDYGLRYDFSRVEPEGDERVDFTVSGENADIGLTVFFDAGGGEANVRCWSLAKYDAAGRSAALELCNRLNAAYRWARFWADDGDGTVNAALDTALVPSEAGALTMRAAVQLVNIVDDAWPQIQALNP